MGTFVKVVLGILVGGLLLIVGCVAVVGVGVDEAIDEVQEESDATSITLAEYESAATGEFTRADAEAMFPEPFSSDEIQTEGIEGIPESDFEQNCVYYNREGEVTSLFQFCFDGDEVLQSKSSI